MKRSSSSMMQQHGDETAARTVDRVLVVDFACFVSCLSNKDPSEFDALNAIMGMNIHGFELNCISAAVNQNHAIEIYIECGLIPLTKLLRFLEDMGLCCISIFTFGPSPRSNGAPEALARIRYRVTRCGFTGSLKGLPSVDEALDFDIRDKFTNWVRFTADQMRSMMLFDGSKPGEVVEWCVVLVSGDTSLLETRLRTLRIASGPLRQYYVKGFECMRMPTAARIYLEIEPIVKTVLLRCLLSELGHGIELMTYPPNQQCRAIAYVSEMGGILIEHGDLSMVHAHMNNNPLSCVITRFTQYDLSIWDCVVEETVPLHWSVFERDAEIARLRSDLVVLQMENSLIRNESVQYSQQCARFESALGELKADRARLQCEVDFLNSVQSNGELFGWKEWKSSRIEMGEMEKSIAQLKRKLVESNSHIQQLQQGELVSDGQGFWVCADDGLTSGLSAKVKLLEQRIQAEFEGGTVFDEARGKNVETDGKTWTLVKWQERELEVFRNAYGSIVTRNCLDELDFSVKTSHS